MGFVGGWQGHVLYLDEKKMRVSPLSMTLGGPHMAECIRHVAECSLRRIIFPIKCEGIQKDPAAQPSQVPIEVQYLESFP